MAFPVADLLGSFAAAPLDPALVDPALAPVGRFELGDCEFGDCELDAPGFGCFVFGDSDFGDAAEVDGDFCFFAETRLTFSEGEPLNRDFFFSLLLSETDFSRATFCSLPAFGLSVCSELL